MAKTRGSGSGKRAGPGKARKPAARKPAARKPAVRTIAVGTKVPKKVAKDLIDLFDGAQVEIDPQYDKGTLTMLRVIPTKVGTD